MREQLEHFLKQYESEIRTAADAMRGEPLPPLTEELFALYEQTGNRITYENVYFRRRKFLAVFGMAAVLYRKPEDLAKLCEVLEEICGETCWALPAHVDRAANPESWMHTVDLFASETAFALAEIRGLLKDALPEELLVRIREEVLERVILPFEGAPVPFGIWENCEHNWNAVCSGSIGCAAIELLGDEPERLEKLLERLQNSLVYYVDGFSDDGACMEGLSYFTYGMSFYSAFAQKLEAYTDGKVDLFAGEKQQRMMEFQQKCYFPGGLSVSFSDGSSQEQFRVGLTCYLAGKNENVRFPAMEMAAGLESDHCYRWATLYRDYLFTTQYLAGLTPDPDAAPGREEGAPVQQTLPSAQWTICSGAHQTGCAAKGGHNAEPHNHNDVGSFHYVIGNEVFFSDLGAGEYTREYFQEDTRYTIFVNQSESHNVPLIADHGQLPGPDHACTLFETDGNGAANIRLENAYGEPALTSFLRSLDFDAQTGTLRVTDAFTVSAPLTITENLVTPWQPQITGNLITLCGTSHRCLLTLPPEAEASFQVTEQTYSDHRGNPQTVYLLRWDVPQTDGAGTAHFEISVS
ncbi:MAG: heparinase II/III family protein [Eubacteriales bacterium]|nr:heparinase II/III family protein [Eubacteriales bacterium]